MKQVKPCPFECNANDCKDCGAYTYSHHTQTNEEWFCQLPTGEKAEFFANIYPKSVGEALIKISNGDKEKWEEWLKEKHDGNT